MMLNSTLLFKYESGECTDEEVKSKGWDTYHALDLKHQAEFEKLKAAEVKEVES